MARKLLFRLLILAVIVLTLNACGSRQTQLPTVEEIEPSTAGTGVQVEENAATTSGISDEGLSGHSTDSIDPWALVNQAAAQSDPVLKNELLLTASRAFLDQEHISTAESILNQIDTDALSTEQAIHYQITTARFKFLFGEHRKAQALLNALGNQLLSRELSAQVLSLQAGILTSQGQSEQAIESRLLLSELLGSDAGNKNLTKLYSLLLQLSKPQLYQLGRSVQHPDLPGWIDLVEQKRDGHMDEIAWSQWHQRHPNHPADSTLFTNQSQVGTLDISANKIALLLPLTSRLGRAADAFKEGFSAAELDATGFNRSRIYDIGEEYELSPLYYRSAINDGADFIIGPLGRQAVNALHSQANLPVSTLLIGLLPENTPHENIWGLGLSPEQDAQAVAERAIQHGFKSAAVLRKNNAWGERVAEAFSTAFNQKGGLVKTEQRFLANDDDIVITVKNLLSINGSEIRHKRLEQLVGRKLKNSVRRRDDIDIVFIAASAGDARKLVPLLKFYRAHDLPLFATSSVFSGKFSKIKDADLNGLNFVDLPWLMDGLNSQALNPEDSTDETAQTSTLVVKARQNLRYGGSGLDRLYALGYAAYEVIPELARLHADPWQQFIGKTMSLRLDENRNLNHESAWGAFTQDGVSIKAGP